MGRSQALQAHILGLGVPLLLAKPFTALMLLALQGSASGRRRACAGTSLPKHRERWWAAVTAIFLPIRALQEMLQELLGHIRALDMNGKEGFPAREWLGSKAGRLGVDRSPTQSGCPGCTADTLPAWDHLPSLSLSATVQFSFLEGPGGGGREASLASLGFTGASARGLWQEVMS